MLAWIAPLLIALVPVSAVAAEASPQILGTFALHSRLGNYKVEVPSCATFGKRLESIQIRQLSGASYVERVILIYADRQTQVVKVGREFKVGEFSPAMDLGVRGFHDSRCLAELFLTAKSSFSAPPKVARIQVWGTVEKTPTP